MTERKWIPVGQGDFFKWDEKGRQVEGVWRGTRDGQYGPLGMIDTPDGGRVNFPLHTALFQKLSGMKEGVTLRIIYNGKKIAQKSGREFKDFEVLMASDEEAPEVHQPDGPGPEDGDVPF